MFHLLDALLQTRGFQLELNELRDENADLRRQIAQTQTAVAAGSSEATLRKELETLKALLQKNQSGEGTVFTDDDKESREKYDQLSKEIEKGVQDGQ
eukprot:942649-Prymnesium_polylepis.1